MSINQLFFAMAGLMVSLFGLAMAFFKYYIDAKVDGRLDTTDAKIAGLDARFDSVNTRLDGLAGDVKSLMKYMIDHSERLASLETKTRHL